MNVPTVKKEVDDVLGGEEAWAGKEQTEHNWWRYFFLKYSSSFNVTSDPLCLLA